jgi:hypothetical protein
MICFLTTSGYDFTLKSLRNDPGAPPISTLTYRQALKESALPEAAYVFTDIDRLSTRDLIAAAGLYRRLQQEGRRVLNDPARVQVPFPLLRALYRCGINPFNVYSVEEGDKPERFPVFLRLSSGHEAPLSDLLFGQRQGRREGAAAQKGQGAARLCICEPACPPRARYPVGQRQGRREAAAARKTQLGKPSGRPLGPYPRSQRVECNVQYRPPRSVCFRGQCGAREVDRSLRTELGRSFQTVFEQFGSRLDRERAGLGDLLSEVARSPVRPSLFGLYTELVESLSAEEWDAARSLANCILSLERASPGTRIVTPDDDDLGTDQAERYARLVDDDPDRPIYIQPVADKSSAAATVAAALDLIEASAPGPCGRNQGFGARDCDGRAGFGSGHGEALRVRRRLNVLSLGRGVHYDRGQVAGRSRPDARARNRAPLAVRVDAGASPGRKRGRRAL